MSPWALVLVFAVGFAGPLIGRLKGFKDTPLASMPRNDWLAIAIGLALVLLALNKHGGQGSLLLALIPVIWILIIDRSFLTAESGKSSSATKPKESKDSSISSAPALINAKPSEAVNNLQESTPDNTTSMPPLAGEALLSKIKEIGDANKSDLVRACGYVGQRADGSERLNFTAFYEALLEAKGVNRSAEDDDEEENEESTPPEQSINLPVEWKELDNSEIIERLKNCPDLNSEILSALAGSDEWVVRQAVAWHDNTPASILETLANDDDSDVQQAVKERSLPLDWRFMTQDEKVEALQSDEIATDIIETLASSENWSLRQAVAWSPSTPDSVLARLRDDDDNDVKFAASEGRILPVEWRFLSVSDKKERLAEQPVPKDILAVLAVDPRDRDVRRAVALHSGTPEELLSKLAEDDDANVQSGVRERELPDQWKSLDDDDRVAALREPGVPEAVLMILARSGNWQIREAVGLSPAAPDAILELLLNDEDSDVQSAVLQRNLPEEWKGLDEDQTVERLNESTVDASILEILAKSGRWSVRQAVAQNSATSDTVLRELLEDSDEDVQNAARKSLKKASSDSSITDDNDDDGENEEHSIYIKTEPGGRIAFGALDADLIRKLQESIISKELSSELDELRYNSYGSLNECEGVVNSGSEGDSGNEGTIAFCADQPQLGPKLKEDDESFEDGIYVVLMRLSKCSIQFEFTAKGGFDEDEFEEISVPVRLPQAIVHGLYGHPDFNVITGFRFRGEAVDEYEGEVVDRGYDDQLTFFAIKDGETIVLHSNYNGEEHWCNSEQAKSALSPFL